MNCERCHGIVYNEAGAEVCLNCGAREEPDDRQAWDYVEVQGNSYRRDLPWLVSERKAWARAGMELPRDAK